MMQEVDRVVARLRGRENEQHDALAPVQTFVNSHMQAGFPPTHACITTCWTCFNKMHLAFEDQANSSDTLCIWFASQV